MLLLSVARQLGSGNSFARLLCCTAQPSGAGKLRPRPAKLIMRPQLLRVELRIAPVDSTKTAGPIPG